MAIANELTINTAATALDMANAIFGNGVTVTSATYSGSTVSSGIYSGALTTIAGISPTDTGVILSTGKVVDFTNSSGTTNTNTQTGLSTDTTGGIDGDAQLNTVAGKATFDGAILNANFIPDGDMITMQFVFSSEEYPEYVSSNFNDAFGVWVNGSFVPVSITVGGNVAIDEVNAGKNRNLYHDNTSDQFNTEMDGFTYVISLKAPVNAGQVNTIKIGIADASDTAYDSNLLIMGDSVQTVALAIDDKIHITANGTRTFDILANDRNAAGTTLTITQINGVNVVAGQTVTLFTGQQVRLNADGTITVIANGTNGTENFTYTVSDGTNTDVGYVTLTTSASASPDGIVSGTTGNDIIDTSYVGDPDGDKVDNNDGLGVQGTTGNADLIYAGAGNDSITAGLGNDIIYGGSGNDTALGGAGDDTIYGDTGNDLIDGGTGNDLLLGEEGDDRFALTGVFGNDTIVGGETNETTGDVLDATALTANTTLNLTSPEAGTITDGTSTTTFSQIEVFKLGAGNDTITGSTGADSLDAGAGNDLVAAGAGNDSVEGGAGNDSIDGGAGNDLLYGGADNDTLDGGVGNDALDGGAGDDTFLLNGTYGNDTVVGGETGETLGDTLNSAGIAANVTLTFTGAEAGTLSDGTSTATFSQIEMIALGAGNDSVFGGTGNDSVDGGAGNDSMAGGAGNDSLAGGAGNDTLDGGSGNDQLFGGTGDDTLIGGGGSDSLYGGTGSDVFNVGAAAGSGIVVAGGEGAESSAGDQLNLVSNGAATITYTGADTATFSDGTVSGSFTEIESITTGTGNDSINASLNGNSTSYTTGAGNDTVLSGLGNDAIYGGAGADSLSGGAGNDLVSGGDGADVLIGGTGADTLQGGADADTIYGGAGDVIDGGESTTAGGTDNDILVVEAGSIITYGGGTNESGTIALASGGTLSFTGIEHIVFAGPVDGTAGDDVMAVGYTDLNGDQIDGSDGLNDTIFGYGGNDSITAGDGNDSVYGGTGNDTVAGGLGHDIVFGDAGNDQIAGGMGNDLLYGGDGTDQVFGDAGDDTLYGDDAAGSFSGNDALYGGDGNDLGYGGIGNDTLDGGAGNDVLDGGVGDDTFLLSGTFGNDTMVGGEMGETLGDTLNSTGVASNVTLTFTGAEAGTLSDGTSTATFNQIEMVALGAGNDSVFGGAGNDSVDGGSGNDSMAGGAGNDSLAGGAGNDTLDGGSGNDALDGGAGDDTFLLRGTFGNDTIIGGETGETLGDTLNSAGVASNVTLTLTGSEAGTLSDGTSTTTFSQIERITLGAGNDSVFGGVGNDSVDGGAGNDSMAGGGGNDSLVGGAGNDTLDGGSGDDALYGGAGNDSFVGGTGADSLFGGNDRDSFFGGAGDSIDGGEGGDDYDVLDLTAYGFAATNILYDPLNHENGTVEFLDATGHVTGTLSFSHIEKVIACFTPGTLLLTAQGKVAVEDLRVDDLVLTRDNGFQPIRWIGCRDLSAAELAAAPQFNPVRIAQGALGRGLPEQDMQVSPQHRMLINTPRAELLFGEPEVLAAALHLIGMPGITRATPGWISYIHILFDEHQLVCADGAWSESFQPGQHTLAGLECGQRQEIFALFPELGAGLPYPAARMMLKSREARILLHA